MEPIAIVTALLGALYIVGRGPLLVAPAATVAVYRRSLFSTPERMRIFGCLLLVLVAVPLIVTARQAPAGQEHVYILLEAYGWFAAVAMVLVIAVPGPFQRLADAFWKSASDPTLLRVFGALNVAVGVFFGWVAFSVL